MPDTKSNDIDNKKVDSNIINDSKKEVLFSKIHGFEVKESDIDDFVRGGYIATDHLDTGFYDDARGVWVRDRIAQSTLQTWADKINEANPRSNKVSVHHEREPHVAGVGVKGTAKVDTFPDGHHGLYVDTLINKTKENFEDTKYQIEKGLINAYSIEFTTKDYQTGEYLPNAVIEQRQDNGGIIRTILPESILEGWTLASQPMNEHAVMIKEVLSTKTNIKHEIKEEKKMTEVEPNNVPPVEPTAPAEPKTVEPVTPTEKEGEHKISEKEYASFVNFKAMEEKANKEAEYKRMLKEIKESVLKDKNLNLTENKVQLNTNDYIESKELKEYKEVIECKGEKRKDGSVYYKTDVKTQFKIAGKMADKLGLTYNRIKPDSAKVDFRVGLFKNFQTNGSMIEAKGLGITTNVTTDYDLSAPELHDVFDPVIYNAINQKTNTWNVLMKDDFSNRGNNLVQFKLKTAANSTAAFYTGNAITTGNVTREQYETKFKKAFVGVAVDGDMIAAARGGPVGDVFAQEVNDSVDDLMAVINPALYAETGLETAAGVIGFEFICDGVGNGTMYSKTRSTANYLLATTATDTYINGGSLDVTISNLRKAIRNAIEQGADLSNLVFFCSPIQYDKIKSIYDDIQRIAPTSARFGFEGLMSFEQVPVFFDKDCNDDDIFLVDLETHRIAMWVPPTLEMLGKDSDAEKGFIKTYFCTYNRAPLRMVMIYGNATT